MVIGIIGEKLQFTHKEFDLLFCLASNSGQVFSREQLYNQVWDEHSAYNVEDVVKLQIGALRKKLSVSGKEYIKNVWGAGYPTASALSICQTARKSRRPTSSWKQEKA